MIVRSQHDLLVTENPAETYDTDKSDGDVLVVFKHDEDDGKPRMMGVFGLAPDQAALLPVGTKVRFCFEVLP